MVTWFLPWVMKWDIRKEAVELAKGLSGRAELEPGQFDAVNDIITRVYQVTRDHKAIGQTTLEFDRQCSDAAVEGIFRAGKSIDFNDSTVIEIGDAVAIAGKLTAVQASNTLLGDEIAAPAGFSPIEESREIILTNRALSGREIGEIHDHATIETRHGVFLTSVKRMGRELPLLNKLTLKTGDELHFTGSTADLDRVQSKIGYKISAAAVTDFIFFGLGMVVGMLIGMVAFKIWGVPISIGSGGGCLLSGLLFDRSE